MERTGARNDPHAFLAAEYYINTSIYYVSGVHLAVAGHDLCPYHGRSDPLTEFKMILCGLFWSDKSFPMITSFPVCPDILDRHIYVTNIFRSPVWPSFQKPRVTNTICAPSP